MKLDYKFTANDLVKLNRTSKENMQKIKVWLMTSSEKFVPSQIQDELIVLFLLSCDNDIDLTKNTVISYYKCRKHSPEMFNNRSLDREDVQNIFKTLKMIFLPGRTEDNNAMVYIRLRDQNYQNFELIPSMKATSMLMDLEDENEKIAALPPNGILYLIDFEGFGIMHLTKIMAPSALKTYFEYLGEGLPMKFAGMHFLNSNYVLDKLLAALKLFLLPDVLNKLQLHPVDWPLEELYKIFPKKSLPEELGGDLESEEILSEKTIALLRKRQDFFDTEEKLRKGL